MHTLQHARSSLLNLFFGPPADGRVLTSWGEILGWVVGAGRLGFLVVSVGYVLGRRRRKGSYEQLATRRARA